MLQQSGYFGYKKTESRASIFQGGWNVKVFVLHEGWMAVWPTDSQLNQRIGRTVFNNTVITLMHCLHIP